MDYITGTGFQRANALRKALAEAKSRGGSVTVVVGGTGSVYRNVRELSRTGLRFGGESAVWPWGAFSAAKVQSIEIVERGSNG